MQIFFYIFSFVALLTAVGVVAYRNPVFSALCLVTHMLCIAGFFALLDAHFLAVAQVIVYAGAVMVLVLFVLMLLNIKIEIVRKPSKWLAVGALIVGALFLNIVNPLLLKFFSTFPTSTNVVDGSVKGIGKELFANWIFPFEASSFLLLAAVAGAVMLAKKDYTRGDK